MKRAQYRMLGRLVRGERLPVGRYKDLAGGTVRALYRKNLIADSGKTMVPTGHWFATDLGRKRHA
jgi:hypothetical protein